MTATLPEPAALLERYLDGHRQCLRLSGPAQARRQLAGQLCQRARAKGLVVVSRELADCDERQLAAWVYADCQRLLEGLGLGRTATYFAAEMLDVPRGQRTLGTISYEARQGLESLRVYDCWTDADGLASSLRVIAAVVAERGQEALLVYGEAQRLRDRQGDWPLSALLSGLKQAAGRPGLRVALTASPDSRRRFAHADGALLFHDVAA